VILAKDFEDFVVLLNKYEVEYMVVGGYAMAFHGKPRYTGDFDIWINISEENAEKLMKVMEAFGMSSLDFKKEDFLQQGYVSQIGYPPLRIDILNNIDGVEFKEAYINREQLIEGDLEINYIGLQDLMANKIASGRKMDLADVQEIKKIMPKKKTEPKKTRGRSA
jgi:predicted nucleotidyltransferase